MFTPIEPGAIADPAQQAEAHPRPPPPEVQAAADRISARHPCAGLAPCATDCACWAEALAEIRERQATQPGLPFPAPAGTRSVRAEGCNEAICGAPIGCQAKGCRFRSAPGYPVQAMGDAE